MFFGRVSWNVFGFVCNFELVIIDGFDVQFVNCFVSVCSDVNKDDFEDVVDFVCFFDDNLVISLDYFCDEVIIICELVRDFYCEIFIVGYVVEFEVDDGVVSISFGIFDLFDFGV